MSNRKKLEDYPNIDYSSIFKKCIADCKRWRIPISKKICRKIHFQKKTDCYAICEIMENGFFRISYTTAGFDKYGTSEEAIYNLFMHEICHTIPECFNHRRHWKEWVKKMNEHGCKINPYPFGNKKEYKEYY